MRGFREPAVCHKMSMTWSPPGVTSRVSLNILLLKASRSPRWRAVRSSFASMACFPASVSVRLERGSKNDSKVTSVVKERGGGAGVAPRLRSTGAGPARTKLLKSSSLPGEMKSFAAVSDLSFHRD